jgi:hypothetical protein
MYTQLDLEVISKTSLKEKEYQIFMSFLDEDLQYDK